MLTQEELQELMEKPENLSLLQAYAKSVLNVAKYEALITKKTCLGLPEEEQKAMLKELDDLLSLIEKAENNLMEIKDPYTLFQVIGGNDVRSQYSFYTSEVIGILASESCLILDSENIKTHKRDKNLA